MADEGTNISAALPPRSCSGTSLVAAAGFRPPLPWTIVMLRLTRVLTLNNDHDRHSCADHPDAEHPDARPCGSPAFMSACAPATGIGADSLITAGGGGEADVHGALSSGGSGPRSRQRIRCLANGAAPRGSDGATSGGLPGVRHLRTVKRAAWTAAWRIPGRRGEPAGPGPGDAEARVSAVGHGRHRAARTLGGAASSSDLDEASAWAGSPVPACEGGFDAEDQRPQHVGGGLGSGPASTGVGTRVETHPGLPAGRGRCAAAVMPSRWGESVHCTSGAHAYPAAGTVVDLDGTAGAAHRPELATFVAEVSGP